MPDVNAIIQFLDEYLKRNNLKSLTPPEANELLAGAGLLADDKTRKGMPLRNLLRAGLIPHAYQLGGKYSRWVIPCSSR